MEALLPQAIEEKSTFRCRGTWKNLGRPLSYTPNPLALRSFKVLLFYAIPSLPLGSPLLLEIAAKPTFLDKKSSWRESNYKANGAGRDFLNSLHHCFFG